MYFLLGFGCYILFLFYAYCTAMRNLDKYEEQCLKDLDERYERIKQFNIYKY